jgi:sulfide:quinone oxidoreductase
MASLRHHRVLIVGGGAAGITTAHLLRRQRPQWDVAILEPAEVHHYQPGWTLVGGGRMTLAQTRRSESSFEPERNRVQTSVGETLSYDALVLATGLQCRWDQINGLADAIGSHGVCSNYCPGGAAYTWQTIQAFQGGNAVFTMPATPIKCGGAPQKVMYMADDIFKAKSGVGVNSRVIFCTPQRTLFSVPAYARSHCARWFGDGASRCVSAGSSRLCGRRRWWQCSTCGIRTATNTKRIALRHAPRGASDECAGSGRHQPPGQ